MRLDVIEKIHDSGADEHIIHILCTLVSEWECYQELRVENPESGLLQACYKEFGVRFLGMYGLRTYEDVIRKAEKNCLLA